MTNEKLLVTDTRGVESLDGKRSEWTLLDQEKWLLQDNDSLQRDIDHLKIEVEERLRKISLAQKKLDKVRHDLITVRMKLMP